MQTTDSTPCRSSSRFAPLTIEPCRNSIFELRIASFAGSRTSARTLCPFFKAISTKCRPVLPLPPKTKMVDFELMIKSPIGAYQLTGGRSEEHTSELQSLMRISYAVFCLKKKKHQIYNHTTTTQVK